MSQKGKLRPREKSGLESRPIQIPGGSQPGTLPSQEEELGDGEMGPSCETFPVSLSHPGLTLGLHAGPDQGQWVAGYLAARAGDGATGQEDEDARVS